MCLCVCGGVCLCVCPCVGGVCICVSVVLCKLFGLVLVELINKEEIKDVIRKEIVVNYTKTLLWSGPNIRRW